jgi:hypothetical protein
MHGYPRTTSRCCRCHCRRRLRKTPSPPKQPLLWSLQSRPGPAAPSRTRPREPSTGADRGEGLFLIVLQMIPLLSPTTKTTTAAAAAAAAADVSTAAAADRCHQRHRHHRPPPSSSSSDDGPPTTAASTKTKTTKTISCPTTEEAAADEGEGSSPDPPPPCLPRTRVDSDQTSWAQARAGGWGQGGTWEGQSCCC